MSAFMVSDETISKIAVAITNSGCYYAPYRGKPLSDVAQLLAEMNENALRSRYEDADEEMIVTAHEFKSLACSDVGLYKLLSCYLYQCSEGTIPKSRLFKKISEFQDILATEIISRLPEYAETEWN